MIEFNRSEYYQDIPVGDFRERKCECYGCTNEARWKMIHAEQEPGMALWWMDDIQPKRIHKVCHVHITTILQLPEPERTSSPGIWFVMPEEA